MTTVDTHTTHEAHEAHDAEHTHPSDFTYVKVALILAVMTAIEVALSYVKGTSEKLIVVGLLLLAVLKFFTVVMYFMHLKFDHPYFRRLFAIGLVLAVGCYVAYLSTLHVWSPSNLPHPGF